MSKELERLWGELELGGDCPVMDPARIRRRVNTSLNADSSERRLYMRQKIRFALVLAATIAALCGTALAVAQNMDVLTAWFEGDTSPGKAYVDRQPRSASDGDYTFTVDSSVSDESDVYLILRVEAKTPEAVAYLRESNGRQVLDGIHIKPVWADPSLASSPTPKPSGGGVTITLPDGSTLTAEGDPDYVPPVALPSSTFIGLEELTAENALGWMFQGTLPEGVASLRVWLDVMGEDSAFEVPITPAETLVVEIGANGAGAGWFDNTAGGPVTLKQVRLTPFSMHVLFTHPEEQTNSYPPILLRLADGGLYTTSQLAVPMTGGTPSFDGEHAHNGFRNYRFRSVMDLSQVIGIVFDGMEYPVDGGVPKTVEVDPHLLPFSLPILKNAEGREGLSVRALCDALGAGCQWDNTAKSATVTYRGSTLAFTLDSETALVNGEEVYTPAPFAQDGRLIVPYYLFAEELDLYFERIGPPPFLEYTDWNVSP